MYINRKFFSTIGANVLLVVAAIIFLITYPFRHDMWIGLIVHISGAAMIGGLADWYAVTALFKKPLGIPYKTALIPRNRERIIEMARTMMVEELLRVPYMYQVIKAEALPRKLVEYVVSRDGQSQIHMIIDELSHHILPHIDSGPLKDKLKHIIVEGGERFQLTPLVINLGSRVLEPETAHVLWLHINRLGQRILGASTLQPYLAAIVESMIDRYAEDSFFRNLAILLGGEKFSPEYITELIQTKGVQFLMSQEALQSPLGQLAYEKAKLALAELSTNPQWQAKLETLKNRWIHNTIDDVELLGSEEDWVQLLEKGKDQLAVLGEKVLADEEAQLTVERFLLLNISRLLQKVRPFIETSVVSQLETYSPEQLSSLLQSKMGYDLQMIRINGSLVGAALGGAFYLLAMIWRGGLSL